MLVPLDGKRSCYIPADTKNLLFAREYWGLGALVYVSSDGCNKSFLDVSDSMEFEIEIGGLLTNSHYCVVSQVVSQVVYLVSSVSGQIFL